MKGLYKDLSTALVLIGLLVVVGFWFGVGFYIGVDVTSSF